MNHQNSSSQAIQDYGEEEDSVMETSKGDILDGKDYHTETMSTAINRPTPQELDAIMKN